MNFIFHPWLCHSRCLSDPSDSHPNSVEKEPLGSGLSLVRSGCVGMKDFWNSARDKWGDIDHCMYWLQPISSFIIPHLLFTLIRISLISSPSGIITFCPLFRLWLFPAGSSVSISSFLFAFQNCIELRLPLILLLSFLQPWLVCFLILVTSR